MRRVKIYITFPYSLQKLSTAYKTDMVCQIELRILTNVKHNNLMYQIAYGSSQ